MTTKTYSSNKVAISAYRAMLHRESLYQEVVDDVYAGLGDRAHHQSLVTGMMIARGIFAKEFNLNGQKLETSFKEEMLALKKKESQDRQLENQPFSSVH